MPKKVNRNGRTFSPGLRLFIRFFPDKTTPSGFVQTDLSDYALLAEPVGDKRKEIAVPIDGTELSPNWTEWLMGWPVGWTSLTPLDIDLQAWKSAVESGTYWNEEPCERTSKDCILRDKRLHAIGNGQAPQAAAAAFEVLTERLS